MVNSACLAPFGNAKAAAAPHMGVTPPDLERHVLTARGRTG